MLAELCPRSHRPSSLDGPHGSKQLFPVLILVLLGLSSCLAESGHSIEENGVTSVRNADGNDNDDRAAAGLAEEGERLEEPESGAPDQGMKSEEHDELRSGKASLLDEDASTAALASNREVGQSGRKQEHRHHQHHHRHHHHQHRRSPKAEALSEHSSSDPGTEAKKERDASAGSDPAYLEMGSRRDAPQHQHQHQHQHDHHQHHHHQHHDSQHVETLAAHEQQQQQHHHHHHRRQSLHAAMASSFIEANGDIGNAAEGGGIEAGAEQTPGGASPISNMEGEGVGRQQGKDKSLLEVADSLAEQMHLMQKTSKAFARAARQKTVARQHPGEHRPDNDADADAELPESMFQEGMQQDVLLSPVPMSTFPHLLPIIGRVTGCLCCLAVLTTALCGKQGIWLSGMPGLNTPALTHEASPLQILGRNLAARARQVET